MHFETLDCVLEEKLENILKKTDAQKKIFVWGYQGGGEIICSLLKQKGIVQFGIIDSTYESNDLKIEKPHCLQGVNPNNTIILLCMKNSEEVEDRLEIQGFRKDLSYFSMVEQVYGDRKYVLGCRHWIEYR